MNSLDIQKWRNKYIYLLKEEEDDDFNITTDAFDEVELKLHSYITPEMWDLNNPDLEDYIDDPYEDWTIDSIEGKAIELSSGTGGHVLTDVKAIQGVLKPKYKIVLN